MFSTFYLDGAYYIKNSFPSHLSYKLRSLGQPCAVGFFLEATIKAIDYGDYHSERTDR